MKVWVISDLETYNQLWPALKGHTFGRIPRQNIEYLSTEQARQHADAQIVGIARSDVVIVAGEWFYAGVARAEGVLTILYGPIRETALYASGLLHASEPAEVAKMLARIEKQSIALYSRAALAARPSTGESHVSNVPSPAADGLRANGPASGDSQGRGSAEQRPAGGGASSFHGEGDGI